MKQGRTDVLKFGTFEVDLRAGELRKQGKRIKLQDQPFQVLAVLLQRPGDGHTGNATYSSGSYEQERGASYREVMDLSNWDRSVAINTPGQSGQPASKHYADLLPLWNDGRYFALSYSKPAVDAATADVLELIP